MDTNKIKSLAEIMKQNDITSLEIEDGKAYKIKLERAAFACPVPVAAARTAEAAPEAASGLSEPEADTFSYITAPMVGVFYTSSAPGEPAFVKEGSIVKSTDTVCIIEAMKLMNDIAAGCDGEIVEVLAENGAVVEYGQKLFKVAEK